MFSTRIKTNLMKFASAALFVLVFLFGASKSAAAASLYMAPSSSQVSVGNIVAIKLAVATGGTAVNNVEGTIKFPTDLLQVVSVSKSSSFLSLWVEDPTFSNIDGTVSFNGGVPNPGYTGENGEVVTVVFMARKSGTASVIFADSAVRANDGMGTNVLTGQSSATIKINGSDNNAEALPPIVAGAPDAPIVTSSTHPLSSKWYNSSNVQLSWAVPSGVTAVETMIGKEAYSVPTVLYNSPISTKSIPDLEDGVWYFHIRFKNARGWGAITHFKIQIDTVPPNPFKIVFPGGDTVNNASPTVSFKTTDSLSGVDHYEVKIGDDQFRIVSAQDVALNSYVMPAQDPGAHDILVKALDLAGNQTVETSSFTVTSIIVPKITDYPKDVSEGDTVRVSGTSYPSASVEAVIEDDSGQKTSQIVGTTDNGAFTIVWSKHLGVGAYTLTVRAIDGRGAKSIFTQPINFTVSKSQLSSMSSLILGWLSLILIIILALGCIALAIWFFIYRGLKMKKTIDRRVRIAEASLHKAFDQLRENVREQILTLEKTKSKRELTEVEETVVKKLQKNLSKVEETLEKDIADIEKSK